MTRYTNRNTTAIIWSFFQPHKNAIHNGKAHASSLKILGNHIRPIKEFASRWIAAREKQILPENVEPLRFSHGPTGGYQDSSPMIDRKMIQISPNLHGCSDDVKNVLVRCIPPYYQSAWNVLHCRASVGKRRAGKWMIGRSRFLDLLIEKFWNLSILFDDLGKNLQSEQFIVLIS